MLYPVLFLLTGIAQTMLQQSLFYAGAAEKTSLLPTAAAYFGVALNMLLPFFGIGEPTRAEPAEKANKVKTKEGIVFYGVILGLLEVLVVCASSLDRLLMFSALSFAGVAYAGSGLYQVIYSSITIFVAVEARILFGRQLTKKAWFGILLTTSGLVISTLGSINENEISYTQLLGIAITLCSTTVYSAIYMMSDYLVSQPVPISTQKLASISGSVALGVSLAYVFFYTAPNWQTLVVDNIAAAGGDRTFIFIGYTGLAAAALGHNWSYFGLIGHVGPVGTGILQSLRAVLVFFASAIFFCGQYESQCITPAKIIATVLVISGLLLYIYSKQTTTKAPEVILPEDILVIIDDPQTPSHIS